MKSTMRRILIDYVKGYSLLSSVGIVEVKSKNFHR
ncbi:hypothetical protein ACHAXS_000158 [Conticribra weissflogii]